MSGKKSRPSRIKRIESQREAFRSRQYFNQLDLFEDFYEPGVRNLINEYAWSPFNNSTNLSPKTFSELEKKFIIRVESVVDGDVVYYSEPVYYLTFVRGRNENEPNVLQSVKDEPAVVYKNGTREWYNNGILHRKGGPAIIEGFSNEIPISELWYKNGELHREGGEPAIIRRNAVTGQIYKEEWYKNDLLHREGGEPAIIRRNAVTGQIFLQEWYKNGELHREGGEPAIIRRNAETGEISKKYWYENGNLYREE